MDRILAFIKVNPGCTTADIQLGMRPFIANPRGRISDLRAAGYRIDCRRAPDGKDRYFLAESRPAPLTGSQEVMRLL